MNRPAIEKISQSAPFAGRRPESPFISFEHVGKAFKTRGGEYVEALRDISFSVGKNKFVTIVGPSGCGKSTLLKLLAGLIVPSVGGITLDGKPVREPGADAGFVFQRPALLPWRTTLGNIILPALITHMDRQEAEERAHELLSLVGLSGFARKFPSELSGGMQQRVAICRALLCRPSLLLMDEPFASLDALTRENLSVELHRIWRIEPKTVLFVTHSIAEAVLLGDQVVVISSRPGTVAKAIEIDIEHPRELSAMLRPSFQEYVAEIRAAIAT